MKSEEEIRNLVASGLFSQKKWHSFKEKKLLEDKSFKTGKKV
ncbi:hypothetical protein VINI7043_03248 [Vibrio nigripulchritudo ATCC 27043]|nr:hypothetical protein VINI7043_03248 [Vibrio nigripulchritudo ATCC 27043]